jgi:choline-glycine betaine transporter
MLREVSEGRLDVGAWVLKCVETGTLLKVFRTGEVRSFWSPVTTHVSIANLISSRISALRCSRSVLTPSTLAFILLIEVFSLS